MKNMKTLLPDSGYKAPELTVFTISVKRCLCASDDWNDASIPDGKDYENDMGSI